MLLSLLLPFERIEIEEEEGQRRSPAATGPCRLTTGDSRYSPDPGGTAGDGGALWFAIFADNLIYLNPEMELFQTRLLRKSRLPPLFFFLQERGRPCCGAEQDQRMGTFG